MPPSRRRQDGLLARVNFPLYALQMLTSRHVLVAGGGGSSKTGVANGFEIFEITHNGKNFVAEEVIRHETGLSVVMNCATYNDSKRSYLVAGQESHCQLYSVKVSLRDVENCTNTKENKSEHDTEDIKNDLRKRRKSSDKKVETENHNQSRETKLKKRIWFTISPEDSVQTDNAETEPCQRVVRILQNGSVMVTGGTDGHVRIWSFPIMKLLLDIKAHNKELDDIDFSPINDNKLITIAKDGKANIWDYKTGKKVHTLNWNQPQGSKYLYKRCRYGKVDGDNKKCKLFTITNPTGRAGKQKAYLQMWEPESAELLKVASVDESLSALAVRDDGRFVAIGTMFSGSVSIYIAFSLQRVLHIPGAHSMFVTGLEFLPVCSSEQEPTITSKSEAAVISISVDNRICIHSLPYRTTMPIWVAILFIVITLLITFTTCGYLGL